MILYHFTSSYHLPLILQSGFLKLVESNVRPDGTGGPDVVWLSSNPDARLQGWANAGDKRMGLIDKTRLRITMKIEAADPQLHNWERWSNVRGVEEWWKQALRDSGFPSDSNDWWMIERIVGWQEWLRIEDTVSAQVWWAQTPEQLAANQMRLHLPQVGQADDNGRTVSYTIHEPTWERLRAWMPAGDWQHGALFTVSEKSAADIEAFRQPGDDDDMMLNRALDGAERNVRHAVDNARTYDQPMPGPLAVNWQGRRPTLHETYGQSPNRSRTFDESVARIKELKAQEDGIGDRRAAIRAELDKLTPDEQTEMVGAMTDEERRVYLSRVAPSINVLNDMLGGESPFA